MAAAEAEFIKALESNQDSFDIQDNYAFYLWLKEGPEAAIAAHKEALSLNPMSEVTWGNHGLYLYFGGKYEQAVRCFEKSIELNPANPLFYILLATSHVENNNPKEALSTLDEFNSLRVEPVGWMGWVAFIYIKCGKKEKSKQILEKLLERSKEFHASFSIALTYSLLGDIESAFLWLNRSIEEHSRLPQLTIKTVLWNNIKSDPRYFDIVNKVGLRV
ncbi:MAG: tetratricopeptide repeat protein [Candidatus Hodarchaeota archaeon]